MKPNWFIGLPLSDHWVAGALVGVPSELRTFKGEDIHVTIAFLGAVGEEGAGDAWSLVRRGADELGPPWRLTLGAILPFGDPKRPSSLSVVPTPATSAYTTSFIARYRNPLRVAAGLSEETRSVRPHATIARIKRRAPDALRARSLEWAAGVPALNVDVSVREVALYTWTEDRREQLFRIVERVSLGDDTA